MKNERDISLPFLLKAQYQSILLAMCTLHLQFADGKHIGVNCHGVARAVAIQFPDFRVIDGFIPRLSGREGEGEEILVRFKSNAMHPVFAKLYPINHSWLVWKEDEQFVLDVWPVGGIPGAAPPVLVYQDKFSLPYKPGILTPGVTEETLKEDVEYFHARFKKACEDLNGIHDSFPRKGKAA